MCSVLSARASTGLEERKAEIVCAQVLICTVLWGSAAVGYPEGVEAAVACMWEGDQNLGHWVTDTSRDHIAG